MAKNSSEKTHILPSDDLIVHDNLIKSAPISLVGAKAKGIANLPQSWVPHFFVLSSKLSTLWDVHQLKKKYNASKWEEILTAGEIESVADALKNLAILDGENIIIRSSSPEEGIELRGMFASKVSQATSEAILAL